MEDVIDDAIAKSYVTDDALIHPDNRWKARQPSTRMGALLGCLVGLMLLGWLVLAIHRPLAKGAYSIVSGIVQSCGVLTRAPEAGGDVVIATIRVPDGTRVQADIAFGRSCATGTRIPVRKYATGAYAPEPPR